MTNDISDVLVIGAGASGSVVADRLSEQGFSVTVLEAGPRFEPARDFSVSEAVGGRLLWNEPRAHQGPHHVMPKTGTGVGGGTLVWLGVMPRFHAADFRTYSEEGVGTDWPIGYESLRRHYEDIEREFGVAGECGPFAPERYGLPMPPHRMNWHAQLLSHGARQAGAHPFAPPVAINSVPYDGRPACVYCGWCASGCASGAKATASDTYLARAERRGARVLSGAFVRQLEYDGGTGRVTGAIFLDTEGREHKIQARSTVLAAHAVETPRLLLLSANASFPDGLANRSGRLGRYLMSHPTWQVFGTFERPVRAFKGMQMGHVMVQDYYRADPRNPYARGFILLSYMMTPVTFANLSGTFFGAAYKRFLHAYAHTAAWWAHAEGLPFAGNRVELDPELNDSRGLPAARITYAWGDNDLRVAGAARDKAVTLMEAAGASEVRIGLQYGAHAMGTCRMGDDPDTSVVNAFGQSHDIRNLFICDTSVFVTGSGVNPTLTAMALASRSAGYLGSLARRGEL